MKFKCEDGTWILANKTTANTNAPVAGIDCDPSCYIEISAKKCIPNQNVDLNNTNKSDRLVQLEHFLQKTVVSCNQDPRQCKNNHFHCKSNGKRISLLKVCDRVKDCSDASDEMCGAIGETGKSKKVISTLVGIVGLFGALGTLLGGGLTTPVETINPEESEGGEEKEKLCNWSRWLEVSNVCSETCGKANRKGKTERRYSTGESCKKRSEERKRSCNKENPCLKCKVMGCIINVKFENFQQGQNLFSLQSAVRSKKLGDSISFHGNFPLNSICSCKIVDQLLKCKPKKKGIIKFLITANGRSSNEKLKLELKVSVGDYLVRFIKNKVDFENFLDSKAIKATELAEDKDVGDVIVFKKVDTSVKIQKDQLPNVIFEESSTKLKFEFPNFFSGVINYDVTFASGGREVKEKLQLKVGKDVFCPSCNKETGVCVISKKTINADSSENHHRIKRATPPPKKRKRDDVIARTCDAPYNSYFSGWLTSFKIELQPFALLQKMPYVMDGKTTNDIEAGVHYKPNSKEPVPINSQKAFKDKIKELFQEKQIIFKKTREAFINLLLEHKIVGLAVLYKARPEGVSGIYNVEFDHIPPSSSYGDTNDKANDAPTVSISNFDHRSTLWKKCSTGSPEIHHLYKDFMKELNYQCAIYTNLKCIRDLEDEVDKDERIHSTRAFERYEEGFKGLIDLHFDYGLNFNWAYKMTTYDMRSYPRYCEIKEPDFKDPKTYCERLNQKKDGNCIEDGQRYFIVVSDSNLCVRANRAGILLTQRNLLPSQHSILMKWMGGDDKAEKTLWKNCCPKSKCSKYGLKEK